MEKFKARFMRFRGGNAFILVFLAFLVAWLILECFGVPGFTTENLNLALSIEASLATCLLLDQSQRQADRDHQLLAADLELARKTQDEVQAVHDEVLAIEGKMHVHKVTP